MAMLDRPEVQKRILNNLLLTIIASIIIFGILLIHTATQVSKSTSQITSFVNLGKINMLQIQKVPVRTGGYQISMKFLPGLIAYIFMWLAIGMIVFFIRLRLKAERI